nr:uncharacterized protein LOC120976652 [Aegilops tauschii subsp. strangulata]
MHLHEMMISNLASVVTVVEKYHMAYLDKNEPRTSILSGMGWVKETLRTPGESHRMFRMNSTMFHNLHDLLVSTYGLKSTTHMSTFEALPLFLYVCGGCHSNRGVQNRFKHSGGTISRKFDLVLHSLVKMSKDFVRPKDPNFSTVHDRIRNDRRMWLHFKDCIGAIDGTHILATVKPEDVIRYIGRSGSTTQNVMAVCDFDMCFTYASIGQPGAMHDSVLYHALVADKDVFLHPPEGIFLLYVHIRLCIIASISCWCDLHIYISGKYYLADVGYPNRPGYFSPFKGQRYHVPDFRRGVAPSGEKEKFNHLHSSIRNVIERTFGVWKMKWRILLKMPSYPLYKQKMIVAATMALHNFIREHGMTDKHFRRFDWSPNYVPTIPTRYRKYIISQDASDSSTSSTSGRSMDKFRDDLAKAIAESTS